MNQIASALLILSASVCGVATTFRPASTTNGFGGMLSLVALGLGLWGGMSLLTSITRERDYEEMPRVPLGISAMNGLRNMAAAPMTRPVATPSADYATSTARDYRLSPELNAQITLAAEMKGQTRTDIVEETLRRHLPRYSGTRAAG